MNPPDGNQRWRERKDYYRTGDFIKPSLYDVRPISQPLAKTFVEMQHYSGSYSQSTCQFGLFFLDTYLVGVAAFGVGTNDATRRNYFAANYKQSLILSRFVLLDSVAANGETWFLGRVFHALAKQGYLGIVSFSDPMPRRNRAGEVVFCGHFGTIYRAHNGRFTGSSRPRLQRILPDGRLFDTRTISKIVGREQGQDYAAAQLQEFGADSPSNWASPREWLDHWLPLITTPVKHPGNLRYIWGLNRKTNRGLAPGLPYPAHEAPRPGGH